MFFATPGDFRRWLQANHKSAAQLWVGFYRKSTGRPSITWPESVDEALCVGWIDGLRKTVDAESYAIRFTPRTATSAWSAVNIGRVADLTRQRRMRPTGLAAFERRIREKCHSYENRQAAVLTKADEEKFRAHPAAWEFFQRQPNGYRKTVTWWVISAKKEETRQKRLKILIADSTAQRRIGALARPRKRSGMPAP